MDKFSAFCCVGIIACIIAIVVLSDKKSKQINILESDAIKREKLIQELTLQIGIQNTKANRFMKDYESLKDSLAIERKNVKIQFVHYKEPVKVDLSTDHKRDSVIDVIIKP